MNFAKEKLNENLRAQGYVEKMGGWLAPEGWLIGDRSEAILHAFNELTKRADELEKKLNEIEERNEEAFWDHKADRLD